MSDGPNTEPGGPDTGTSAAVEILQARRAEIAVNMGSARSDAENYRRFAGSRDAEADRLQGEIDDIDRALAALADA